ncbi:RHS repeat-associated core domain-containing protein [Verrucomicrobiota bacterium]
MGNRYCWQGREYSWKTGLYYFRARWYEPVTARLLSNDPIGISGGLNQYVFCFDDPVNYMDPFGLRWFGGGDDDDGWTVGRPDSLVPPGPGGIGGAIETYVPAMETMSEIHDALVGALVPDIPVVGPIVDTVVNVPTMPVTYNAAVIYETGSSIVDVISSIIDFFMSDDEDGSVCK